MIAVFPVWRSEMISSRWPRPIGIIESIALMPVCTGSLTGWRRDHAGCDAFDRIAVRGGDRALAVDRLAERVHHPADHLGSDRHLQDAPGAPDLVALADGLGLTHEHAADAVLLEVEGEAEDVVRKRHQLAGHDPVQAEHPGDAVADRHDSPDLGHLHGGVQAPGSAAAGCR